MVKAFLSFNPKLSCIHFQILTQRLMRLELFLQLYNLDLSHMRSSDNVPCPVLSLNVLLSTLLFSRAWISEVVLE